MIRPLLLDAPSCPSRAGLPAPAASSWGAGRAVSWRRRSCFWLLDGLLSLVGRELPGVLSVPAGIVRWLFVAWLAGALSAGSPGALLWRIRTKLIVSYLFIALVPVVLLTLFMCVAVVLLLGLTASRLVTGEVDRTGDVLLATARTALAGLPASDADAARRLPVLLAPARELHPGARLHAPARRDASSLTPARPPSAARLAGSGRLSGPGLRSGARPSRRARCCARSAEGGAALVLELPIDAAFLAEIEKRTAIHVLERSEMVERRNPDAGNSTCGSRPVTARSRSRRGPPLQGHEGAGLLFVAFPEEDDWESGEKEAFAGRPSPFQYDPRALVRRLSPIQLPRDASGRSVPDLLLYAIGIVGVVFVVMYGVALVLGLVLARSITRGVHALSVGTERLRQGDFSHQIALRSRDQLGELAESFNLMSRGIQQLMREQAEKERLEEELRIARQIQMSLLPGTAS